MTEPEIDTPPRMGRPSEFSDEIFEEICVRMAGGGTLRKICQDEHLPARETVIRWVRNDDAPQAVRPRPAGTGGLVC